MGKVGARGSTRPDPRAAQVCALLEAFGMLRTIGAFLSDQDGATAIEYALIASLIAVFIIGALSALGTSLSSEFAEVGSAFK
jgi:pilus assembly protein Flp/PilA